MSAMEKLVVADKSVNSICYCDVVESSGRSYDYFVKTAIKDIFMSIFFRSSALEMLEICCSYLLISMFRLSHKCSLAVLKCLYFYSVVKPRNQSVASLYVLYARHQKRSRNICNPPVFRRFCLFCLTHSCAHAGPVIC